MPQEDGQRSRGEMKWIAREQRQQQNLPLESQLIRRLKLFVE